MGFNFVAASPWMMYEEEWANKQARALLSEVSESIPFGKDAPDFVMPNEMGWSWWSQLQVLAADRLGKEGSTQIRAIDAEEGVYVDANIDRVLIWPNGKPENAEHSRPSLVLPKTPWYRRPLQWLGLASKSDMPPEVERMLIEMIENCGARQGERGALQVGNLRLLHSELSDLATQLGYETTLDAMNNLLQSYSNDERYEEDIEIQCLCHAWLTSKHAIDHGVPMWLLK